MRLLLDTHILLWAGLRMARMPALAARIIEDTENELIFSSASIWEIAIKRRLERDSSIVDARVFRQNLLANGYLELAINGLHSAHIQELPKIHKDPFDRILVAQALVEGMLLLTSDRMVARYPGPIQKV
jgi:PIN domain nuclease of toxin-antitoxin system